MTNRRTEVPLFVAIFLDLLGFGMIVVDIQFRAVRMTPAGWKVGITVGAILASTFVVQTLVSPFWGAASDRIGRKPIVVACTLLSATAMFIYGGATSVWWLFASRILAGLSSANVAVAQALIADVYDAKYRTVAMGRIGAAITAGLVAGAPIGGLLSKNLGSNAVGYIAGGLSLLGAVLMALVLPNPQPTEPIEKKRRMSFNLALVQDIPKLRGLATIAVVAWFSLAMLEGTFGRLIHQLYGMNESQFGYLFGYESVLGVVVQTVLLAWLTKRFAEPRLLRAAYAAQGAGLALNPAGILTMALIPPMGVLVLASTLFALGTGVASATVNGMCSRLCPEERQGELFGLLQGTRSFGFVVGPLLGGTLFDLWAPLPYVFAGLVCAFAAFLVPS